MLVSDYIPDGWFDLEGVLTPERGTVVRIRRFKELYEEFGLEGEQFNCLQSPRNVVSTAAHGAYGGTALVTAIDNMSKPHDVRRGVLLILNEFKTPAGDLIQVGWEGDVISTHVVAPLITRTIDRLVDDLIVHQRLTTHSIKVTT